MKRFWMTAAVAALCAFGADAWAAPPMAHLELVASHSAGDSEDSTTTAHHRRHKAAAHKAARSRRSRAERSEEASARTRHGHRHAEASVHGRHGRRHAAEETSEPVLRGRHGRHRATEEAETPVRGRHGRRRETVRSEIHTEGGSVKVGRRDTLEAISERTGVSVQELARLNHLRRPYHVRRGERLKLPERRYYVVKSGETLYSLGRRFGVETSELADLNGGRHLRAGQKLYLPGGAVEAAPPEEQAPPERLARRSEPREPAYTEPFQSPSRPSPPAAPLGTPAPTPPVAIPPGPSPYQPAPPAQPPASQGFEQIPPRTAPAQPAAPTPPTPADVASAGRGKFVWPVQGPVLSGYGHKADGTSNDGLNISGENGDPVRAAADGEVVYAGDQVPSFGNLVLIKHPGGWVTAYAHMGRILVKNRDAVVQGQQIGVVGQTGSVDRPQVHFEIRYAPSPKDKATPVDPSLILPQR